MSDTLLQAEEAAPALPDRVRWSEGMLLAPQHLQQADQFWLEQLRFRFAQLVPHAWGIAALELDTIKLREAQVVVQRLECVMPDGTPLVFPGSFGQALRADVADALAQSPEGVRVWLALPAHGGASNGRDGMPKRYDFVRGALAVDEDAGAGTVAVDRLRPRLKLHVGDDIPAQYVALPLLEIARRADTRAIELRPYHPPLLRWQAADFLHGASLRKRLLLVAEALWLKLREMGGHRNDDGPDTGTASASGFSESARRLAAVLPHFTLVAQRPEARPHEVYDALAQLVGVMAGFGANPVPPVLDAYRHENCEPQFRRALDYVVRKLGYIQTRYELLAFEREREGAARFVRELPEDAGDELLIELRLADGRGAAGPEAHALERWLKDAVIASHALHGHALRSRVSARVRLLDANELARRQLRASGAVFAVINETVELGGARQALLHPGERLVIEGYEAGEHLQPVAIFLHRPRGARPARETRGPGHV
jgi:type VI secretion system protein ImpJ